VLEGPDPTRQGTRIAPIRLQHCGGRRKWRDTKGQSPRPEGLKSEAGITQMGWGSLTGMFHSPPAKGSGERCSSPVGPRQSSGDLAI